jgi:hypothetical protein
MEETKITRGRGGKNNFPTSQPLNTEPGDNSKYLRHALVTLDLPPIDISNVEEVEGRIWWYFDHCVDNDMKPTVSGMCNALGIHRDTLATWRTGEFRAGTHQAVVLKAYRLLEELWENYMMNGKINPVSGIFLGKNNFGYRDSQEYVVTPNMQQESMDPRVIEQKYDELPDYGEEE